MEIHPHYPPSVKNKISQWSTFFNKSNSWLDSLYEKSYTMKMGTVKLPGITLYIPNEPLLIRKIMIDEVKDFPKHPLLHETLQSLLGESTFTSNDEIWKRQRRLLNPSFENIQMTKVFRLMSEASEDMLLHFETLADGDYHNIDEEMSFVSADIIFRTILSQKLSRKEGKEIIQAFQTFQEQSAKIAMQKMFLVPKIFRSFRAEKIAKKAGERIRSSLSILIKSRYEEALDKGDTLVHQDILSSLLKVQDQEGQPSFSFREILDQVSMLFLAGHETSASAMSWTLYLLGLYPEIQEEAYETIMQECAEETFTASNIKKFIFLSHILKESLRLYPPIGFFARVNKEETTLRNKVIPKGTAIILSPWLMQRNANYWEDPHLFRPKRFEDPSNIHKYTYFPFGLGKRTCIGEGFALQESILLLASILRKFKIVLKEGFVPDIAGRLTIRSLNGIPIKFIKREK
jgi:cytochrome P450